MPEPITPAKLAEMKAEIVCRLISIGGETADYAAARIEELETLERAAIELVRSTKALSAEVGEIDEMRPIPKGSDADWACCRHDWANREFWALARKAATAEKGKP